MIATDFTLNDASEPPVIFRPMASDVDGSPQ